jgi:nucleotide-binding universal stress UspA family protein
VRTLERLLLAVDDSPAALAAARMAIDLAAGWHARLRVVNVMVDGHVSEALAPRRKGATDLPARRELAGASVLSHVLRLAEADGVHVEVSQLQGDAAQAILADAQRWRPDLLVIGLSSHDGIGTPYVGAHTRHILEFADLPVLVIPAPRP